MAWIHGLADRLTALGYLVVGAKLLAEPDKQKMLLDIADEQLDTLGKGLMGDYGWQSLFFAAALPVLLIPAILKVMPESMPYLLMRRRSHELQRIAAALDDSACWIETHDPQEEQQARNGEQGGQAPETDPVGVVGKPAAAGREPSAPLRHEGRQQSVLGGGEGDIAQAR